MANDSLTKFANGVYAEARKKREKITEELEAKTAETIKNKDEELKRRYKNESKKIREEYEKDAKLSLTRLERELSATVIKRRAEIEKEVFTCAEEKLREFTELSEYKDYIKRKLEENAQSFNKGEAVCKARECDLELIKSVSPISNMKFETAEEDIIGGFILINREIGIYADCTLRTALSEEKDTFLRISGLGIK